MPHSAKGGGMLTIPGNARLFLCQHPVNMKKSFEGLSGIVEELFPEELLSGSFFIAFGRDHSEAAASALQYTLKVFFLFY